MSRKKPKKKRQLKPSIYIVCEGTNTERIYFEAIAQQDDVFERFAITVYPSEEEQIKALENPGKSIKTDAKNLVKIASDASSDYDEVWAVFDKDGYTKHQEAFNNARQPRRGKKAVNIAFSSIAFEHWILLHYEQNRTAFNKSRDVVDRLSKKKYFSGYSKKADTNIYSSLKNLTKTAIENAAWLRMEMEIAFQAKAGKIYQLNPYVTVDELVRKLLNFNRVTYGKINQTVEINEISIKIKLYELEKYLLAIDLTVINHQDRRYLIHNNNQEFFVTNEDGDNFPMSIANSEIIDSKSEKDITLNFSITNSSSNLRFNFIQGDRHLIIDL
ncbi:MAG: RloB domain-containing protein [Okeania sp. SIO2H7]|nr:RloB domain-containing protein [Okeania sp. SIO2H7]